MSTPATDQLPLTQTMGLLDCAEMVRQQEITPVAPVKDPVVLRGHLQTVCASLSQPLSTEQADKAVALYLDKTAGRPMATSAVLADRPANEAEWRERQQVLENQVSHKDAQVKRWHRHAGWLSVTHTIAIMALLVITAMSGGLKLLTLANPGGPPDHWPLGTLCLLSLFGTIGVIRFWEGDWAAQHHDRLKQELKELRHQRDGLRDVKVDNRPTQQTMKDWMRAPGVAAAFYQIHVSGVPLLEQDCRAFKNAITHHNETVVQQRADKQAREEEEARLVRDREWTKGFEALAMTHLDSNPSA